MATVTDATDGRHAPHAPANPTPPGTYPNGESKRVRAAYDAKQAKK